MTPMNDAVNRRDFLGAGAALAVAGTSLFSDGRLQAGEFKTKLYRAMIRSPKEKELAELEAAGFDGLETSDWKTTPEEAEQARKLAEKHHLKIHSVLFGWANFNQPEAVEKDIANVQQALRAAQGYGASALLLVPCRTGVTPIPEAWEFDIAFDEKTGRVTRVAAGDNSKYAAYIEAQNQATEASRKAVERLIPTAEKTGVIIALENVWNNLWVKPKLFAHFVASFQCPWVRAYFDIGNHVKYAPPEQWFQALGKLIVKLHVKDFKLNPDGRGGKFVHPRDGSINWPSVRQEIEKIGYNGFLTIEDGGLSLEEFRRRLDLIIAGK
jgi:L-ribulose-5-phosphate 3-epimerase